MPSFSGEQGNKSLNMKGTGEQRQFWETGNIENQDFSFWGTRENADLFACVEVLWPNQPYEVMSGIVSLPNHTFTGQV